MTHDREDPLVELAVSFTGVETDLAYQILDDASGELMWIPFSQTEERHGKLKGGAGTILITEWLARRKGLVK
jgi:hypothetical protein